MGIIDTSILFLEYIMFAIVLAALSIMIGPQMFKRFNYEIIEKKSIRESDAISYFLQALLAVVLGFLALSK